MEFPQLTPAVAVPVTNFPIQIFSLVFHWNSPTELKSEQKMLLTKAKQSLQYTTFLIIYMLRGTALI